MVEFMLSVLAGVGVALLFSLAVFVHEFGHFIAARWLGLQVDAFSIGFGPAIWKRKINGVEYKICWIPFGGYVALPQLDPSGMEKLQGESNTAEERASGVATEALQVPTNAPEVESTEVGHDDKKVVQELPDVAPWKRIVVSVAGPFGNVVLAVLLAYFIFWMPSARTGAVGTRVGMVEEESAAWHTGLRSGDTIATVNGRKIATWTDLQVEWQLAGEAGSALCGIERQGQVLEMQLELGTNNLFGIMMLAGVYPESRCEVGQVVPGSAAAAAGLRQGDLIVALDDTPVTDAQQLINLIGRQGAKSATLTIQRAKGRESVSITPRFDEERQRWMIGIVFGDKRESVKPWMMYRNPWQQLKWDSLSVMRVLQALVAPDSKGERKAVAKNIGGPVAIVMGLYSTVRGNLMDGFGFLRMICINLAILNLLPLPVLDGGHIMFALYEIVTRRKPHPKVVALLVNTFAIALIGMMLLLAYTDIAKRIKFTRTIRQIEMRENLEDK